MEQVIIVFADIEPNIEEREEFKELIHACAFHVVECFYQALKEIHIRTYIGKGKCEEIRTYIQEHQVTYVAFHHDLTPLQIRQLEDVFEVTVLDRTDIILMIFEKRAHTPVSKLQVEQAKLERLLPRLIGAHSALGRQGSGKNKGSGEKQLELDRRRIKARLSEVRKELIKLKQHRSTQRKARQKSYLPLISLVGYTNAGKSTIMNHFLHQMLANEDKKVFEEDMLFATLDTSIRHIKLANGDEFLLSDTVGFINHLPHGLFQAFSSTLEEVAYADILLQVVDASSEQHNKQMDITQSTLQELKASHIPMITIYNKCDKTSYEYPRIQGNTIYMSAKLGQGYDELLQRIHHLLFPKEYERNLCIPYLHTSIINDLLREGRILKQQNEADGIHVKVLLSEQILYKYRSFII